MEYTINNDIYEIDINTLRRPPLIRQLNIIKWMIAVESYDDNSINMTNICNNYSENGIFFNFVEDNFLANKYRIIHYLAKINNYFFQIVFKYSNGQELPKIKYITKEEYKNIDETILINKIDIFDIKNNIIHYFLISYNEYEERQKCYITTND